MGSVETVDKQEEYKYYYAFVFGDGCLEKPSSGSNSRLRLEHVSRNLDYCEYKQKILEQLTTTTVTTYYREDKQQSFTRVLTGRHPTFTKIRERMYLNGVKTIDPHMEAFLDWETLAIIYQDDGTVFYNQWGSPQVFLCTENFTWAEQKMFRDWLAKHFNLHWEVVRKTGAKATGYRLRLKGKHIQNFWDGVRPYIVPSMLYKLGNSERKAPVMGEDTVRSCGQLQGQGESPGQEQK